MWLLNAIIHRIKYYYYKRIFLELHRSCTIIGPNDLSSNCIIAKERVLIRKNARIEGVSRYMNKCYNPRIILNEGVHIEQNCHITCANKIEIGKNTSIAAHVTITDIHHSYEDVSNPIEKQDIVVSEVLVGEDCKIYNGAVILPGCHIGKHVTIGANSVVNKDIPDYCVVVGAPAHIIKRYNFGTQKWEKTDKFGNFLK